MVVSELRLVVTTDDYDAAVAFYRDRLGLVEAAEYISESDGRVVILEAGKATLEIADARHAEHVDQVEVGPPGRRARASGVRRVRRGGCNDRADSRRCER